MSSISGVGSSSATTPLQRAEALADTATAGGKTPVYPNEQFAEPYIPSQDTGWSYGLDTTTGDYSYTQSDIFGDTSNVFDQIGVLTPVSSGFSSTFQQINNPSGNTPGISQTVALKDQISYQQQVANRTPAVGQPKPANQTPANLGRIGTNAGRLILLGKLDTNKDDVDTYTFNLQDTGNLRILAPDPNSTDATASLGDVHMQVMDSKGNVVADSDPSSGEAYLTYVKLDQSALTGPEFQKGQYTIKLSYNSDAPADAKGDYSLFIVEGTDPGRINYYTSEKTSTSTAAAPKPATIANPQDPALSILS